MTIGAVPWVVNYNVPLHTDDMTAARAVAMAVSTRGGGPAGVQVNFTWKRIVVSGSRQVLEAFAIYRVYKSGSRILG